MKKQLLIVHHWMELGGAEKALLGLLSHLNPEEYDVDLFLCRHSGELLSEIPNWVNLLPEDRHAADIARPMKQVLLEGDISVFIGRLRGKAANRKYYRTHPQSASSTVAITNSNRFVINSIAPIQPNKTYDLAISFMTPHYIVPKKVNAKKTIAWIHTDYSTIDVDVETELSMWDAYDYIASISDDCTKGFLSKFPSLSSKIVLIENMLPSSLILHQADEQDVSDEICMDSDVKTICSVGRFSEAKNFDNVPDICRRILEQGVNVKWYLVGYGGDEELIRRKIEESGMQEHVIILGKKENPYPYMKVCDLYAQPSRYEGKCVAVREAQTLGKPVVITRYATSASQLEEGVDGVIVPMDNEGCAAEIAALLRDPKRMGQLSCTCQSRDYSNAEEVEKIYQLMK